MRPEKIMVFTQKEEEFSGLLISLGIKRNIAKVLVYLASIPEATSREIERGTDLRQPEVSIAMHRLIKESWVESRESKAESKGRPVKIYRLSRPIGEIVDAIEEEKRQEAEKQRDIMQRLRTITTSSEDAAING
jgi:predicted transcriptional regulator